MEVWLKGGEFDNGSRRTLLILPVTTPADVEMAIQHGVDGIVVSNHGGRQLDGMPSTIDALAECAPVARGRIRIVVDGGIRRGSDVSRP